MQSDQSVKELKKVLLLYNVDSPEYRKRMEDFCGRRRVDIRYVLPEEYDVPLGFLAYGREDDRAEFLRKDRGKEFAEPMMVLSGFDQKSLFAFLKDLQIAGIGTSPLKAMMTEHNAVWDSVALYEELSRERQAIREMQEKALKKGSEKEAKLS